MMFGWFVKPKLYPRHEVVAMLSDQDMELAATVLNAAIRRDLWNLHEDPLRFYQVGGLVCVSLFATWEWAADGRKEVRTGYGTTPHAALCALLTAVDPFGAYHDVKRPESRPVSPAPPKAA